MLHLAVAVGILVALGITIYQIRRRTNGRPWQWLRARLGWGLGVKELAHRLGVEVSALRLQEIVYREVTIPKRRGGQRLLHIPAPDLKRLQRRILRRLLGRLRVHPAACGYEAGKSIVDNAAPHVAKRVVIKMDIVDFFRSTGAVRIDAYFRRVGWNRESAELLTRLCTHNGGLPQGAPTSPRLSNLVNYAFDAHLHRKVAKRKGAYTRYADDIAISFPKDYPRRVRGIIQYTRRLAKALGYTIHVRGKLRILRAHQQQRVTGLVVNEKLQLPRKTRRRLRAVAHHLRTGRPATLSPQQLAGWNALQAMIERRRE